MPSATPRMAVIVQQGAGWGDPIVWVFILTILVVLGLLVGEIRNTFSPAPALVDDRWGLRRSIAGFPGGPATLGALSALIAATLVFAAISSPEAEKGRAGVRPPPPPYPPLFKLPEGGKRQGHARRGGQRRSKYRGADASRARKRQPDRALEGERIAVRGPKGVIKGDPGYRGPKGDGGVRGPRGRSGLRGSRGLSPRRTGGGSHGSSGRARGSSGRPRGSPGRPRGSPGGRRGLISEALPPARKLCDTVAGILRCP